MPPSEMAFFACAQPPVGEGMYLYDESLVMVRYEKNTMVLPNENYEERGYQPKIADLLTRADWLKQFDSTGEYIDCQTPDGSQPPPN
jgi:hypothetical protein